MRAIITLIIICISASLSFAGDELMINLDRLALLIPDYNSRDTCGSRVAIGFSFPEDVEISEVFYAELVFNLDFSNIEFREIPILELQVHSITAEWNEEDVDWSSSWDRAGGDIDTLDYFTYSITMSDTAEVYLDVTAIIKSIVENGASNNGLMIIPIKRGEGVFNLSEIAASNVRNNAYLKIKYR